MNGSDITTRWKNLKVWLGFNGIGCCGASWSPRTPTMTIIENPVSVDDEDDHPVTTDFGQIPVQRSSSSGATNTNTTSSGMNLAMALAVERNLRVDNVGPRITGPVKTLMRLIEETEGVDWGNGKGGRSSDWVCCVCMERNKGAAFIPCGHTFCRICSRDLWAKRKTCPICNRLIIQVLDIF
ncbi:putative ubiquitin-protein ligase [Tripterygium wilfordii]|uniref:Putative ubiquitin-protein ligase n=1 Tax=Tripterygium wilfordii TaxID=458696 RepID=A0A7J7D5S0_TRIWF|nr:uncharacterized protein LOC120007679 [Tripterygium wilfordii]XP_038713998.1 uncharacterized protein LOC120007679 [Tripterygium wilfordii]KAF5741406.1 putative ubiquitin-protein ligase [Tripterygium wilfordii]